MASEATVAGEAAVAYEAAVVAAPNADDPAAMRNVADITARCHLVILIAWSRLTRLNFPRTAAGSLKYHARALSAVIVPETITLRNNQSSSPVTGRLPADLILRVGDDLPSMRVNFPPDCCVFVCDELRSVSKPVRWRAETSGSDVTGGNSSTESVCFVRVYCCTCHGLLSHNGARDRQKHTRT